MDGSLGRNVVRTILVAGYYWLVKPVFYTLFQKNKDTHTALLSCVFSYHLQIRLSLKKSQLIKNSNLLINLIVRSWSANRCLATVSRFMNLCAKMISKYKNNDPATLKFSWFNKNTNHQDTPPLTRTCEGQLSDLMVRDDISSSKKSPIRKGEWYQSFLTWFAYPSVVIKLYI